MQRPVIRATVSLAAVVLMFAVAFVALGDQPKTLSTHSGGVPSIECPFGVSPAQSRCYATAPPRSTQASKAPDTDVPPASMQASTAP